MIIDHEPFTESKDNIFFISKFQSIGYNVEFWSVYKALKYSRRSNYPLVIKSENVIYIDSYKFLVKKINEITSDTVVILEIFFNWETMLIFWILKSKKIKILKIDYYLNTSTYFNEKSEFKFTEFYKKTNFINLFKKILRFIIFKTSFIIGKVLKLNKYEIVFLTGSQIDHFHNGQKKTSINYFDIENFKNLKASEKYKTKYVVFLDINLPNHPDLYREKLNTVSKEIYFTRIKSFFESVESQTGYEVIIAAHPKSNYTNEFGKHKFFYNQTAELVTNCEFVLLHNSASLNFALLAKKPIVFFYFNFFLSYKNYLFSIFSSMKVVSKYFDCHLINVDTDDLSFLNHLKFDINKYDEYLKNVIVSDQYPKSNFQIVKETIMALKNI